ncbi:MAG TPA: GNAT family N-acetyltransferase [Vicinamibacterales bacterium]|nr:GNAT family N-acetyltransferase [Vicinamibacterales bacterium]
MNLSLRVARVSDAADIAQLTGQLGYEVEPQDVAARLSRILARTNQQVFVAEVDGRPAGWLHAALAEYIEAEAFVVIAGLVVDRRLRGKGIGRMLMAEAEDWANKQHCSIVRLWSTSARTAAHEFYRRLGYMHIKTQYSFVKSLDPAGEKRLKAFVPRIEE